MKLVITRSDATKQKKKKTNEAGPPMAAEQQQSCTYGARDLALVAGGLGVVSFLKNLPNRFRSGTRSVCGVVDMVNLGWLVGRACIVLKRAKR